MMFTKINQSFIDFPIRVFPETALIYSTMDNILFYHSHPTVSEFYYRPSLALLKVRLIPSNSEFHPELAFIPILKRNWYEYFITKYEFVSY